MTKTKRIEMINSVIDDRVRQKAYFAWYAWQIAPTDRGTILKSLKKV